MNPRVTIGLPVYNGENFLSQAIESVLAQSYTDFEIVISDNGSVDDTQDICEEYAAQDSRIRYYRAPENRGASWNYNRTVELARGQYFRWLAHDDKLAAELLEKSVAVLDADPGLSLCSTYVADIDGDGNLLETKHMPREFLSSVPSERFKAMTDTHYSCEIVFGLMPTEILRRTNMIADYADSDRTLIAELGLHGRFYEIPEVLFLHRQHNSRFVNAYRTPQERTAWFNPAMQGKLVFPVGRQLAELVKLIGRSPLPMAERIKCYVYMLEWFVRGRRRIRQNLRWAVRYVAPATMISWRSRR